MKYRLLIVDDEYGRREEAYESLLGGVFDLNFISTQSQFESADLVSPHAILVDVNLNGIDWAISLKDVLDRIKNKPVVLVSGKLITEQQRTRTQLEYVLRYARDYNIIHFVFLNETAENAYIEATRIIISFALDKHYGRARFDVGVNDPIHILHISDPQFGDAHDPSSFLLEKDVVSPFEKKKGAKNKIPIDFIALTGDITYSGLPKEFEAAAIWIESLMRLVWDDEPPLRERLLFVPGNHDVNLSLLAANRYRYSFKGKKYTLLPKKSRNNDHCKFGLSSFREFAYQLTHDLQCLTSQDLCWINDSFRHLGLRFYHLNSAANITSDTPDASGVPQKFLTAISKTEDDTFPIVLSHHGPPHPSDKKVKPYDNWDDVKCFLKHSHAKLLLHGHGHARTATRLDDWDETKGIVRVMAPSTHLIQEKLQRGEGRGFNVITLIRENMRVKEVKVVHYEYHKGKMRAASEEGEGETKFVF